MQGQGTAAPEGLREPARPRAPCDHRPSSRGPSAPCRHHSRLYTSKGSSGPTRISPSESHSGSRLPLEKMTSRVTPGSYLSFPVSPSIPVLDKVLGVPGRGPPGQDNWSPPGSSLALATYRLSLTLSSPPPPTAPKVPALLPGTQNRRSRWGQSRQRLGVCSEYQAAKGQGSEGADHTAGPSPATTRSLDLPPAWAKWERNGVHHTG